jgi:hypothetical protein
VGATLSDGTTLGALSIQSSGGDVDITGVAVQPAGDTLVTGVFTGTLQAFGNSLAVQCQSSRCAFVARIGGGGTPEWHRVIGSTTVGTYQETFAVSVTDAGVAHVVGRFTGTVDFGDIVLSSNPYSGFLLAISESGSVQWATQLIGAAEGAAATGVAGGQNGPLLVTGWFNDQLTLGEDTLSAPGTGRFHASFSSLGVPLTSVAFGGIGAVETPLSIQPHPCGVLLAGMFEGDVSLGDVTTNVVGGQDFFVGMLPSP